MADHLSPRGGRARCHFEIAVDNNDTQEPQASELGERLYHSVQNGVVPRLGFPELDDGDVRSFTDILYLLLDDTLDEPRPVLDRSDARG